MAATKESQQYVKWSDVIVWMRWLEAGYGRRVRLTVVQACPKGEQYPRLYWEASMCDDQLNACQLPERALGRFPSEAHKTVPGMLLGMLIALDNIASQALVWTEPTVADRPDSLPNK